jgi:hypothetical protein
MKTYFSSLIAAFLLTLAGCSPSVVSTPPTVDTSRLDSMARSQPELADFASRVKLFYEACQAKNWPTTYEMRTADFKQDVERAYYLKTMSEDGKRWSLNDYKILNINLAGDTNGVHAAQMIMKFQEGGLHSYQCAVWKKESGTWICDEPGLSGLPLLHSTRAPSWDNH